MTRRKKKPNWPGILALGIGLTLLTANCQTVQKTEYVHVFPDVTFPVFPPPDCVALDEKTEAVSMPLWYWQKIAEYKIDVDAIEEYLARIREAGNEFRE